MASQRRPIEIEDLCQIKVVSEPEISPDGRRVAFVVRQIEQTANDYHSAIWMVDWEGGQPRQFTSGSRAERMPRWSPDGRLLAFLSDRAPPVARPASRAPSQIFLMPSDGGEARQLTRCPGGVQDLVWSPLGDRLAFVARVLPPAARDSGPEPPPVREITRIKHKADGKGLLEGRAHIFVVDLAGGQPRQLTDGDWDDENPAWSPDGSMLAFASNRTAGRDWNDASDIWTVAVTGGRARRVTRGNGSWRAPAWSPNGQQIAMLGRSADAPAGANVRVWLVPARGGAPRCLTAGHDLSVGSDILNDLREHAPDPRLSWSADGARIRLLASTRGNAHLFEIDVATEGLRLILGGERQIGWFSVSADDARIAFDATTPLDPGNVCVASADGNGERAVTDENRELLDRLELVRPERCLFAGAGGQEVEGWFMPGRGPGKRPTLLEIHGGPHSLYGNAFFHEFQVLAARGYNVLYTNPRGSRGYGERFCSEIAGAWGELDFQDLMAAVDAIVDRPDVDPDRLGVLGGSYGGFMTNWIVGHTGRFKAAVTMRCLSNFLSFYGTSDIGTFFSERELLGTPTEQLDRYVRMSPITYVDRVETPLLILHGDEDYRCPLEQAEQLFVALRRRGKPVEFLRFPGESHNMSRSGRPDRRLLRLRRIVDWFDRWLAPAPRRPSTGSRR